MHFVTSQVTARHAAMLTATSQAAIKWHKVSNSSAATLACVS